LTVNVRERLLREDLNIPRIRERLQRRGIVEVRALLSPAWANRVQHFLARDMPPDWWSAAIRADGDPEYFPDTAAYRVQINEAYGRARTELREGRFSYSFRRTFDNHLDDCGCCECHFRGALRGEQMLEFLFGLGLDVTGPGEMFASKYSPGSFLSPHHDSGNGRAAFVINLTRSWLPQWGGLLMFLNDDWRTVRRVCTPAFNTLCLFALPGDRQVPHLVTQVVAHQRLAFTGWYVATVGGGRS
jgi:SM-20-related protein